MNKAAKATVQQKETSRFDAWFGKKERTIFYVLLALCIFLSLISFNARISEAHDDALYLEGGWRFVNEFPSYFYTQNAPMYPMFLALLILVFGFKLIVFKLFSTLFNVVGFVLFYRALRGKVRPAIFLPVMIFQATQYLIIYYASMTFTESLYFMLQGFFFLAAVNLLEKYDVEKLKIKQQAGLWLVLGLSMFLISSAKSAAIVVLPAIILYFLIEKDWKAAGVSVASYLVFKLPFDLIIRMVWGKQNQFKGQSRILLQKDPYDSSLGEEDIPGFIQRFFDNANLAMSKRFYQLIGWQHETNVETNGFIAFLTILVTLVGLWLVIKNRNRVVLLFSLFTGAQLFLSWVILQARWDQPRITLVCMPVVLLLIFYAIHHYTSKMNARAIYLAVVVLVIGSVLLSSFKRGFKNIPIVKKNLKGDKYYGYTPDWENFLKASEWCAVNLPDTALVASRKAPMSFVYGNGKRFFPVYSVVFKDSLTTQSNPDSALAYFRKNKVTHVIVGSLRINPFHAGTGIINTVHNILAPIARKYPDKLELVHTEGAFETAEVYEFRY